MHLLITYPPKAAISRLVNSLKNVSSCLIRKKHYPTIERALWGGSLWSPSYFAGSAGGAPLSINKRLRSNRFAVAPYDRRKSPKLPQSRGYLRPERRHFTAILIHGPSTRTRINRNGGLYSRRSASQETQNRRFFGLLRTFCYGPGSGLGVRYWMVFGGLHSRLHGSPEK